MVKLRAKYGAAGYGLYWYIVECIGESWETYGDGLHPELDFEIIEAELRIVSGGATEMLRWMVEKGLFERDADGVLRCSSLGTYVGEYQRKAAKTKLKSGQSPEGVRIVSGGGRHIQEKTREENTREKNKKTRPQAAAVSEVDAIFDRFYSAYPRKKNKPAAFRAWRKHVKTVDDTRRVSAGLKRDMSEWDREGRPPEKVPYPATWINALDWQQAPIVVNGSSAPKLKPWERPIPPDREWEVEGRLELGQVYRDGLWVRFEDLDPDDPDYRAPEVSNG